MHKVPNIHVPADRARRAHEGAQRFGPHHDQWVGRHNYACTRPRAGGEQGIVSLAHGIRIYVADFPHDWPDGVATPYVGDLLHGFIGLLNFELGRLDGGTLDGWARDVAAIVGWNLDEMKPADKQWEAGMDRSDGA